MNSSGFADAPISKYLLLWIVSASILASFTDMKHYFYIQVVPHLRQYKQIWRLLIWPVSSGHMLLSSKCIAAKLTITLSGMLHEFN